MDVAPAALLTSSAAWHVALGIGIHQFTFGDALAI